MPPAEPGPSEYEADARGIMQCLGMLTEEAASLRLARTCEALRQGLEVCASESGLTPIIETTIKEAAESPAPPGILH